MKILIADDDAVSRRILQRNLEKWGFEVIATQNGEQAWEVVEKDDNIPLLITDWMMPKLDGLGLARKIRENRRSRYLHIIMLTAKSQKEDLIEGMQAGVDAFLVKPFDSMELQAQIHVAERMIQLENELATQLDNLSKAHELLKEDLQAAAQIQHSLLPSEPPRLGGLEFSWVFDSCDEVAGDMCGAFALDEHRAGIYVLDVSGHGVPAALLSVSLSRDLSPALEMNGLLKCRQDEPPYYRIVPPAEVACELNRRSQMMGDSGQFFTFLYGIIDIRTLEFRYVRAGHIPPIHLFGDKVRQFGQINQLPIGFLPDIEYKEESITLSSGHSIILLTDGVEETHNRNGEQFGPQRVLEELKKRHHKGIRSALIGLHESVFAFRGERNQKDDITMIGFSVK